MPELPPKFRSWQQPKTATVKSIIRQYERGFQGCVYDPESVERLASYGASSAEQVCADLEFEDSAAGELVIPYVHVEKTYPTAYPGPGQQRGDCVSHCGRNAGLVTLCSEAISGQPDPVSGKTEEAPEVSPTAEKAGVLATEAMYHYRGHRGDGWFCPAAADVMVRQSGAVLRQDYGFADLTKYNPDYAGKYFQGSQVPDEAKSAFDNNLFQDAADANTFEAIRDLLARGLGVLSCGSEGFDNKRDDNGFARRKGSWAHAMAVIGADDREETKSKYGQPALLIQNSWAKWNTGPRRILGTQIYIPEGCFWAKWSDIRKRNYTVLAGVSGWQRKLLPDLALGFV